MTPPADLSLGPLRLTPGFLLGAALLLLLEDGYSLLCLFLAAGLCHELGHCLAARLLGLEIRGLRLSALGAELEIPRAVSCSYPRELAVLAAGPLANLALTLLCRDLPWSWAGTFAGANLLLACFNLLPVPPLDGGQMLRTLAEGFLPQPAGTYLADGLAGLTRALALAFGVGLALRGNPTLLLLALWLALGQ